MSEQIIEHEGKLYRKVYRDVHVGDLVYYGGHGGRIATIVEYMSGVRIDLRIDETYLSTAESYGAVALEPVTPLAYFTDEELERELRTHKVRNSLDDVLEYLERNRDRVTGISFENGLFHTVGIDGWQEIEQTGGQTVTIEINGGA